MTSASAPHTPFCGPSPKGRCGMAPWRNCDSSARERNTHTVAAGQRADPTPWSMPSSRARLIMTRASSWTVRLCCSPVRAGSAHCGPPSFSVSIGAVPHDRSSSYHGLLAAVAAGSSHLSGAPCVPRSQGITGRHGGGDSGGARARLRPRAPDPCHEIIQLPEDQRVDFAHVDACRRSPRLTRSTQPSHLTATATSEPGPSGMRVECQHVERADDRAHRATDALLLIDQHKTVLVISIYGTGWANLEARGGVAMSTPVRKGKGRHGTRLHMDTLTGNGLFEEREHLRPCLPNARPRRPTRTGDSQCTVPD